MSWTKRQRKEEIEGMSWTKRQRKEEIADVEERCFICKDGGDLRACDFKDCLKAYNPQCAGNEDGLLSPDDPFICDWHICVQCRGRSDYHCLCCPLYSVCHACLGKVEFVQLRKQNKGFCSMCLDLAISIEKDADADPHVAKTEYRDAEFYRVLFKDYWEGVKDSEHLTLVDLEEASVFLNRRLNCKEGANLEEFPDDDYNSDENIFADNDANDEIPFDCKGIQNKVNTSLMNKSNKRTYVGWGSEELIEFLSSFGKDTSKPLDKVEIVGVVKGYIKQKNLYKDNKKNSFLCDHKLQPLFKRKKVRCKMISKFLSVHLASNAVSDGSRDDDAPVVKKKPRNSLGLKVAKRVSRRSKRCFASFVKNNINLIYLRRTLVVSVLNPPDTFEHKVIGCFVRVKTAPRGQHYQMSRRAYQLGLVTGIKKSSEEYQIKEDTYTNVLLRVTGLCEDVKISMLSHEDFAEDECTDLISLVEKGFLKRSTIAELEAKVATVNTDIVSHRIERELVRVAREIDRAQIKGWRVEMEELLNRKRLLSTPAERQRLLEQVPEIVPDTEYEEKESELEVAASSSSQENRGATHQVVDSSNVLDGEPLKGATEQIPDSLNLLKRESSEDDSPIQAMDIVQDESDHSRQAVMPNIGDVEVINLDSDEDEDLPTAQHKPEGRVVNAPRAMNGSNLHIEQAESASPATLHARGAMGGDVLMEQRKPAAAAMDGVHLQPACAAKKNGVSPLALLWYYVDPQGDSRGPFSLMQLLRWKRNGFFDDGFRVWKTGQTTEQAILLTDAFRMNL